MAADEGAGTEASTGDDATTDDAAPAEDAAPVEDAAPAEDAAPVEDAAPAEAEAEATPEPELLHGVPVSRSRGQVVLHPSRDEYPELIRRLRNAGYLACIDLCAVDYLGYAADRALPPGVAPERFEVVVLLLNHRERARLRVRVQVPAEEPTLPSLVDVHPGLGNPEREAFDMFGIVFEGHPDMSRILMPEDWEGYPLRKDYPVGRIPVQFKAPTSAR